MRPVILLAQLNDADLAVDALKSRLAEIAEALREPAALAAARRALAEAEAQLARCRSVTADAELAQQSAGDKLARAEQQLYGGKIHNPRELEDAERNVQQQRSHRVQAEERTLEALIACEEATAQHAERQAEVARLAESWQIQQARLRAEQAQRKARLPAALARQAAARRAVSPQMLTLYDGLRPRRGGRAVAALDGDVCSVCLVAVSPSKLAAARSGDELAYCENCGRLLWEE